MIKYTNILQNALNQSFKVQTLNFQPLATYFWNRTKKVTEAEQQVENQSDDWKGKEKFLKELRQKREEFEKLKLKQQKEQQQFDQRSQREHEVNYGSVDYAQVLTDNVNVSQTVTFNHPEELFHFISGLRVRLSQENLALCLVSFIQLADRFNEADLQRPEFKEFLSLLSNQIRILPDHLVTLFQFLDIYCVSSQHPIWEKSEQYLLSKLSNLSLESLITILGFLGNQKEGTEFLWDQSEKHLLNKMKSITQNLEKVLKSSRILISYWKVQRGQFQVIKLFLKRTKEFIQELVKTIATSIIHKDVQEQLDVNTLIQIATVHSSILQAAQNKKQVPTINQESLDIFAIIENCFNGELGQMNMTQICMAAQAFGFNHGSEAIFRKFEDQIIRDIQKYTLIELKSVIKGFLLTYRGSKKLFTLVENRIIAAQHDLNVGELADLVKAYHITENENPEFIMQIEKTSNNCLEFINPLVVRRLKEVRKVTIQEIYDIAKSYLITRIGSREFYKLLEIVIKFRFDEIRQDAVILQGLHQLYLNSGLCSPKLLERFETFM